MAIYAYNNNNNSMSTMLSGIVPLGIYAGQLFDAIYTTPLFTKSIKDFVPAQMRIKNDMELQLLNKVVANDVVITATLTNFSLDFISALKTVHDFISKGVHVIAYAEEFDSRSPEGQALLSSLPLMEKFRKNSFEAKREKRRAGIEKAVAEGKYTGRKAYDINDFPNFNELYNSYMFREIGKGEFAEKLGVSRPTLDRLIDEFTRKKGD